jgi:hypothetical protein
VQTLALLAAALLVSPSPRPAARLQDEFGWVNIGGDLNGKLFLAKKKTAYWEGRQVDVVVQVRYRKPTVDPEISGRGVTVKRSFFELDCAGKRTRLRGLVAFDERGSALARRTIPSDSALWNSLDFGTEAYRVYNAGCALFDGLSERWVSTGVTRDQLTFYDSTTVVRNPANVVQVWTRQQYKELQTEKDKTGTFTFKHSLVRFELDCLGRRWRMLEVNKYAEDGRQVQSNDFSSFAPFAVITPESSAEGYSKFVCPK